ncbi:hypothetical protein LOZ51_006526 [Ophidiomyces ophidiicola]|nr:hypothetical protein LOZ55_003886 [Ophidiomyces ophidiicola]KAI1984992.1 hypothetical protein LOZ51_006526 [Ophidiomyces ophidiicola]KAI1987489.1 hypothetical protein LOZ54_003545 [Ophidiomyces ophidiicola]
MSTFACEATIPGPVPEELHSLFVKYDEQHTEERPVKRRKVKSVRAFSNIEASEELLSNFLTLFRVDLKVTFRELSTSCTGLDYVLAPIPVLIATRKDRTTGNVTTEIQSANSCISLESFDLKACCSAFRYLRNFPSVYGTGKKTVTCSQCLFRRDPDNELAFHLVFRAFWRDCPPSIDILCRPGHKKAFDEFFAYQLSHTPSDNFSSRVPSDRKAQQWAPRDFYNNVHVPKKDIDLSLIRGYQSLNYRLYPFQRRAVGWLLEREGVEALADGTLHLLTREQPLPLSFARCTDADGRRCFVSHLYHAAVSDISQWSFSKQLKGGILAEEMGLGKTVELLTLICLHRRPESDIQRPSYDGGPVRSGASLIVTPSSILEQWRQEISRHLSDIQVMYYPGMQHSRKTDGTLIQQLASQDIVLTTYNALQRDLHFAQDPPDRALRNRKRLPRRKSPLVQISWWRVCIDEAQMVESGVTNAAKVALLIPRCNAWAVTGTPLRKDMKDLFGLLRFLQCEPFSSSLDAWTRLYEDSRPYFKTLIQTLVMRHNKSQVCDELHLPRQQRIVITIPFTAVEEQHYEQLFKQMCEECGIRQEEYQNGVLESNVYSIKTIEKMRSWLNRLRQACLHPEITTVSGKRAFGSGPLRSVADVLEVMIDQNDMQIRSEERRILLLQIRRGQLQENAENPKAALEIWKASLSSAQNIVADCRDQLAEVLKNSQDESGDSLSDEDEEADDAEKSRIASYQQRLRSALEIEHISTFFIASAYYQIKSNLDLTSCDSKEFMTLERLEEQNYEAAKLIRKEMLAETSHRVNKRLNVIREKAERKAFIQIPYLTADLRPGGIESRRVLERLENFSDVVNRHATTLQKWRTHMVQLILRPLVDEEDGTNLQGDEYESSTKVQEEMYVYMEAVRAMIADYHDAITGQTSALVTHEMTQAIEKARIGGGPSPRLFISLMGCCKDLKPPKELGSLRGILNELRTLVTSLEWQESGGSARARSELTIIEGITKSVSTMFSTHSKVASQLEKEIILFQNVTNRRLEYYRHLQQISDTVAPYNEESKGMPLDKAQFNSNIQAEDKLKTSISGLKSKRRYLIHLRDETNGDESSRICIICQSSFEIGVLTVCGHKYCKECLHLWWRQHRTCPACKHRLARNELHQITYKPSELLIQEEKTPGQDEFGHSMKNAIYSDIKRDDLKEIKNIELSGSFGTKIDTLSRHLIWLRQHDPGAKSIVFSQYKSFLGILASAFSRFKIEYSSIDSPNGIELFKKKPSVECFLLHAKAHSSGLNLLNATHVFLCEPLINTAIELQAIARVHRIGQHRETTVWMYLISGTVEESIYQISVSRRLAHIVEKQKKPNANNLSQRPNTNLDQPSLTENILDAANSLEMQEVALGTLLGGATEGERVRDSDLYQCLFGKTGRASGAMAESVRLGVDRMLRADAAEERRNATNPQNIV